MKNLLLFLLASISISISAQSIPTRSLIGIHEVKIQLAEGVSIEQYIDHFLDVVKPAYEKAYRGTKVFIIKGRRGECTDCIGMMWFFASESVRDIFFDKEGNMTPYFEKRSAMIQAEEDSLEDFGEITSRSYTDWIVQ